ncbi:MAG: DUF2061 domain-containing protein [Planctomycetota bacterium]
MDTRREAHLRSIMKAVSYRFCAAVVTTTVFFIFTRKLILSIGAGAVEALAKIVFYYVHERFWSKIRFGQPKHPLSSLQLNKPVDEKDIEIIKDKLKELGYISED